MDTAVGPQMLTDGVDVRVGSNQGIQGIDAPVRCSGSVSSAAEKFHLTFDSAEHVFSRNVQQTGMEHHGCIHPIENAGFRQPHLAATTLFSRRSNHRQAAGRIPQNAAQGYSRTQTGRSDHVMPTAMADLGQGIIFRQKSDCGPAWLAIVRAGQKRRLEIADAPFNPKTLRAQHLA